MGRTSAVTGAVKCALDKLADILSPHPLPSRGWDADLTALSEAWTHLNDSLHDAGDLIKEPQVGYGLESAWLRAVCFAVADVDAAVHELHFGWSDVLRHGDDQLGWLINDLRYAGEKLISGNYEGKGDVSQLLEPVQSPLTHLRRLASSWISQLAGAPSEPVGLVPARELNYWQQRKKLQDGYLRRAGELVLRAVDSLDINSAMLNDRNFLRCVVHSIDFPAYLPSEMLGEKSGEGLLVLVERLEPAKDNDIPSQDGNGSDPSTERHKSTAVTIVIDGRTKKYSTPRNYPRDKWIYENIDLYDYQTLSKMLQDEALSKKWKIIKARNAFKVAADRYANFHEIEERRFPDDRIIGQS